MPSRTAASSAGWRRCASAAATRSRSVFRGSTDMMSITHAAPRDARLRAIGILGFAGAVAAASQIAIPLPFTPVPITLQPMLVILAGMWLGPMEGAASMTLYLAAGAMGLPVFTPLGAPGVA